MKVNYHTIMRTGDTGNGYHGRCKHCGIAHVTDLGYDSLAGTKCIDREVEDETDIPSIIKSFASFTGLVWNRQDKVYTRPYSIPHATYTIDELMKKIEEIKGPSLTRLVS